MKKLLEKSIAVILSIVLLIGILPVCNYEVKAEILSEIPEGYTPIYTFEDLYNVRSNTSGNYILMNNIDLAETAKGGKYDSGSGWACIPRFTGVFDGNGYSISNMTLYGTTSEENNIGFFEKIGNNGIVKNLTLDNINISMNAEKENSRYYHIGGIAGVNFGNISNCKVSGNISCITQSGGADIGGIVALNYSNVLDSSVFADIVK